MSNKIRIGIMIRGIEVRSKEEVEGVVLNVYDHIVIVFPKQGSPAVVRKKDISAIFN
ncbi:TPA: hypothetical protein IWN98_001228 [Enterococcus faecium]|uniref:DUF2187 domain-containing protein n=4 Tax=Enterococcus TaxID=1350 RepID=A0A286KC90_ENTAV|nr:MULTISPECIES: hypothetical protein [Enterococcus]APB62533.1 hypothetical protein pEA19081_p37 [Enterococcus avium]APB62459.1 hypothetical protein pEMA120_p48 [Enterococcus faecium]EMF0336510.1 hypothetical protein [Enterococcus faecium]EOF89250.1 hypothetical protein SKG_02706 [Enterococcus faecium EnGen0166]EOH41968.1 hypothetical protein SSI_03024 [Enterococcus faecium EnGen0191]